jgi:hypothetical protein
VPGEAPLVVLHLKADGDFDLQFCGQVQVIVVDECAPDDRLYELTLETERQVIMTAIGGPEALVAAGHVRDLKTQEFAAALDADQRLKGGRPKLEIVRP